MNTHLSRPPDVAAVLAGLKDFQSQTVDYVFGRLFTDPDYTRRFLIADEVGLGKTLVARGLVAKTVEHLWDKVGRVDIVYVCSNGDIARQNVKRLTLPGYEDIPIASRITLLPITKSHFNERLNFISFTPSTSFDLKSSGGLAKERALLYWLLRDEWGFGERKAPKNVLQGWMGRKNFRQLIDNFNSWYPIDETLAKAFRTAIRAHDDRLRDNGEETLRSRFDKLAERFKHTDPASARSARDKLTGEIRTVLAASCVNALEPDLVILDEFQRFRHLLQPSEMGELAKALFDYPEVRVLLLSATPYKMYTLSDEVDDDHYRDFVRTLRFLFGDDEARAVEFEALLATFRRELLSLDGARLDELLATKDAMERGLRGVMVRTERLAASPQRHGMLEEVAAVPAQLTPGDVEDYLALQRVATCVGHGDTMEYWKSAPYLLNFMEDYDLKTRFEDRCELPACRDELSAALDEYPGLTLDWDEIGEYGQLDPANTRLRALLADTVGAGAWRRLWMPPALPYYRLSGPFAGREAAQFTKRLVFSSWNVVPKAIATLVSYEAERAVFNGAEEAPRNDPEARRRRTPLLRFQGTAETRLMGMPVFGALYPCATLARELDPLRLASRLMQVAAAEKLPSSTQVLKAAQARVQQLLDRLDVAVETDRGRDDQWYWAAPILLDLHDCREETREWFAQADLGFMPSGEKDRADDGDGKSSWLAHVARARELVKGTLPLGEPPKDLARVLATMGVAGPGAASLRALARSTSCGADLSAPWLRTSAARIAWALRNLFNLPESIAIVRGRPHSSRRAERYWRQVLDYCFEGCLPAALDEYAHVLRESLGLFDEGPPIAAAEIAEAMRAALSLRTATLRVDDVTLQGAGDDRRIELEKRGMRAHFALRFGDQKAETGEEVTRASQVRDAFNSPFWPFVLATTSVGQEGLDFHLYCHAVVHWNLPSNPVDLEQREGRVHRYKGHAVRKNLARVLGMPDLRGIDPDEAGIPGDRWTAIFAEASAQRGPEYNDLWPYWIYTCRGGATIDRHVPVLPLSRDLDRYEALRKSLAAYRMVFGQARQEDLMDYLLSRLPEKELRALTDKLTIDLSPPTRP